MKLNFDNCLSEITNPKISLRDIKQKSLNVLKIENKDRKKLYKIQVDDCLNFHGQKCDWLVVTTDYIALFVELKGQHVQEGLKQVENTIKQIEDTENNHFIPKNFKFSKKNCYIISSRCPLSGQDIQKAKQTFRKNFSAELIIKTRHHTVDINNFSKF